MFSKHDRPLPDRKIKRFVGNEIDRVVLWQMRWFEPEPATCRSDAPPSAERYRPGFSTSYQLLEQRELRPCDPFESNQARLGVKPPGAKGRRKTTNEIRRNTAIGIPWVDPLRPAIEFPPQVGLARGEGTSKTDEVLSQRRTHLFELGKGLVTNTVSQMAEV